MIRNMYYVYLIGTAQLSPLLLPSLSRDRFEIYYHAVGAWVPFVTRACAVCSACPPFCQCFFFLGGGVPLFVIRPFRCFKQKTFYLVQIRTSLCATLDLWIDGQGGEGDVITSQMESLGSWTAILQSCSISPTFCSVASLPIESTPLSFLGWHLNGVGPLRILAATTTAVRRQGPPVGRRARGTWTATLDYAQKTLHLGAVLLATQDGQNGYARDKRPGLLVLHSVSCSATLKMSRPKP